MQQTFDVIVIGSGPGGYVAAIRAAQLGLKTACIEKSKTLGGTCLNEGCIPSKALLHTSEMYAWINHHAAEEGIILSNLAVDFPRIMQRKLDVVKGLTDGIASLFKKHNITWIEGTAKFTSPNQVEVEQADNVQKIEGKSFILAMGSESTPLPFLPYDEKIVLSSTGALSLPKIPKKLLVIGGGVIGVELASVYQRLGSEVVIVEMLDRICAGMEESLSKALLQTLKKQGIEFHLGAKVIEAKTHSAGVTLKLEKGESFEADCVLVAVGRRPYTTGACLDKVGVQLQRGFVVVDKNFRTNIPHIYAIGDLIEGTMLAHRASEEGYAVAELIAGHKPKVNYIMIPNVVYTHPEVASLGLTEAEARATGKKVQVGTAYFRGNPRARCVNDTEGFVKAIGLGEEGYLIGLHIMGPQASEMIHAGMVALEKRATLADLADSPFSHPTLSEAIKEACGAALHRAVHT